MGLFKGCSFVFGHLAFGHFVFGHLVFGHFVFVACGHIVFGHLACGYLVDRYVDVCQEMGINQSKWVSRVSDKSE